MADSTPRDDQIVRPFADFLREISGGKVHDELSEKLHELVQAIEDTGKAGSITFSLSIKPMEKGNTSALLVNDKISVKAPMFERKAAVFFPDNGNLVRNDPNQLSFDSLRDASATPEPRELDARERAAGGDR